MEWMEQDGMDGVGWDGWSRMGWMEQDGMDGVGWDGWSRMGWIQQISGNTIFCKPAVQYVVTYYKQSMFVTLCKTIIQ